MRSPIPFPLFTPPSDDHKSGELQHQLWLCVFYRLQDGESLVTAGAFLRAMEEEYLTLTRRENEAATRHIDKILGAEPTVFEIVEDEQNDISIPLDPIEIEHDVQVVRVAMRVAGRTRYVPYKIMLENKESGKHLIVRRDPASGAVVPALKRGICLYVERDNGGFWKLAS